VGPLRWKPPQPVESWSGVRDARKDNKPKCVQQPDAGTLDAPGWVERLEEIVTGVSRKKMQEDCLFINVQTPNVSDDMPVMLHIHGGTNLVGSGSKPGGYSFKAQMLCDQSVVFVSFNYRLGVLGVLALPEALAESGTTGNYALQDHRAAMNWVQRNIHMFGGNPRRVTISGESSGAMAVAAHLALPRSHSLFSQAIMMSGNDDTLSLDESYAFGNRYVELVGCQHASDRLACLRGLRSWELVNMQTPVYNETMRALQVPVADGFELPFGQRLRDLYASGSVDSKPVILGTNKDEISMFLGPTSPELLPELIGRPMVTKSQMYETLPRFLPNATKSQLERAWQVYNPDKFSSPREALYELGTDGYFACPTRRVANALASHKPEQVYHYIYTAVLTNAFDVLGESIPWLLKPFLRPVFDALVSPWLGSFHGSNMFVFWGLSDNHIPLTSEERGLGARMVQHWASFLHTGAPLSSWRPTGGPGQEHHYEFGLTGDHPGDGWHVDKCNFLEEFRFVWNPLTLSGGPSLNLPIIEEVVTI